MGIKHSIPKEALDILNFFKQVRNLYTHGEGTINQIFLKKNKLSNKGQKKYLLGEKFQLTDEFLKDLEFVIKTIINRFDSRIIRIYPDLIYK